MMVTRRREECGFEATTARFPDDSASSSPPFLPVVSPLSVSVDPSFASSVPLQRGARVNCAASAASACLRLPHQLSTDGSRQQPKHSRTVPELEPGVGHLCASAHLMRCRKLSSATKPRLRAPWRLLLASCLALFALALAALPVTEGAVAAANAANAAVTTAMTAATDRGSSGESAAAAGTTASGATSGRNDDAGDDGGGAKAASDGVWERLSEQLAAHNQVTAKSASGELHKVWYAHAYMHTCTHACVHQGALRCGAGAGRCGEARCGADVVCLFEPE